MEEVTVAVRRLSHGADLPLPSAASALSAGVDLHAAIDQPMALEPGARVVVPTGMAIALPAGFEAQIRPRSGLAAKWGITVLNSPGTVDADYRGEIGTILINLGQETFTIEPGMRIAQLVIGRAYGVAWRETDELPASQRGADGFGSTGTAVEKDG